jgi:hypothetical protein
MEKNLFLFCRTKFNGFYKSLIINIDRGAAHNISQDVENKRNNKKRSWQIVLNRIKSCKAVVNFTRKNVFVNYHNNNIIKQLRAWSGLDFANIRDRLIDDDHKMI